MQYRELSNADIKKIIKEIDQSAFWQEYKEFADKWYSGAVRLECTTQGEYNDEGGTDYSIESITAYDAAGNEIEPTFNEDEEYDYEDQRGGLPIADEDEYAFTIDLTQPPKRPRIAIIEDEHDGAAQV